MGRENEEKEYQVEMQVEIKLRQKYIDRRGREKGEGISKRAT